MFGKENVKALDIIGGIRALEVMTEDLYEVLRTEFPKEGDCCDCNFCSEFTDERIDVPLWAKEAAGFAKDTKFYIIAEEETGRIILEPIEHEHDLSEVSEEMRIKLCDIGICLGELNESIINEEIIDY